MIACTSLLALPEARADHPWASANDAYDIDITAKATRNQPGSSWNILGQTISPCEVRAFGVCPAIDLILEYEGTSGWSKKSALTSSGESYSFWIPGDASIQIERPTNEECELSDLPVLFGLLPPVRRIPLVPTPSASQRLN